MELEPATRVGDGCSEDGEASKCPEDGEGYTCPEEEWKRGLGAQRRKMGSSRGQALQIGGLPLGKEVPGAYGEKSGSAKVICFWRVPRRERKSSAIRLFYTLPWCMECIHALARLAAMA